jgi:hypothetical protein
VVDLRNILCERDPPTDRAVDEFREAGFFPCESNHSEHYICRAMIFREHISRAIAAKE